VAAVVRALIGYSNWEFTAHVNGGDDCAHITLADYQDEYGGTVDTLMDEYGLLLDFARDGRLLGIEFLDVSRLPTAHTHEFTDGKEFEQE
jgi:hypothetical protein